MDRVSVEKRTEIMRKIRGKNTAPELFVRKLIFSLGYRYRLHYKKLPGCPDLAFPARKKVIFVHGCFWHYHGCKKGQPPKSRLEYWLPKLGLNKQRDAANLALLENLEWKAFVVWQCELQDVETLQKHITEFLHS